MNDWYCKTLGCGDKAFKALKQLRVIRYQACSSEQTSYHLAVDVMTADTIVYFPPASAVMAIAFGASTCGKPILDGRRLRRLDFEPLQIKPDDSEFFSAMIGVVRENAVPAHAF